MATFQLGDLPVEVVHKNIKNVHLSVYPPSGKVKVSAPLHMELETIRVFVISKLSWIKKQQKKLKNQKREAPRDYIERESHYYQGKRYQLKVIENQNKSRVELNHKYLTLYVRPESDLQKRQDILNQWYREQLKQQIPKLIDQYEKLMDVDVAEFGVKRMKTKWGTCNPEARRIWVNLELAKKPPECLEYIVVHEMLHLLEASHNNRFTNLMDLFLPKWRLYKDELNRLPVRHELWRY
ncbi:M48 family metallopeptidase [Desulfobacter curvatus]|uniref:M48 family metallopeptidase n=1 Tax=Desulfobacter curvatus TaxID=2290 RepID=UPI00036E7190|nr:SprT family zinc-dependent metalloprotease [Desulfobacter curvatus]